MAAVATTNVAAGIKQLAARIIKAENGHDVDSRSSCDTAWSILLDLDTSRQALPDVQDRRQANTASVALACDELSKQHRTGDATQLQQLVQEWLSETLYATRLAGQQEPAAASHFAAVPLTEQHAVLSLLLALRGSSPAGHPALASLPALGSSLLKGLQQEAQAAAAAAASTTSSSAGWVPMSSQPYEVLTGSSRGSSSSGGVAAKHPHQLQEERQDAVDALEAAQPTCAEQLRSWVSPAAAAMQLLQQMPLDAAACSTRGSQHSLQQQQQQQAGRGPDSADEVLIAAACSTDTGCSAAGGVAPPLQSPLAAAPLPLLQQIVPQMQLASGATLLGRPLLLHQGASGESPAGSRQRHNSAGRAAPADQRAGVRGGTGSQAGASRDTGACSAAAAEAEAAVAAAAVVRPRVKTLMQLSSEKPSDHLTLGHSLASSKSGNTCGQGGKGGSGVTGDSDTAPARDVGPALSKQRQQQSAAAAPGDSKGDHWQGAEAELVSTACLALQGVWSAVECLWGAVLEMSQQGEAKTPARRLSLCQPAVQQQLLVWVLHTAELRLRLKAFLLHFQHSASGSSSSHGGGSDGDCSSREAAAAEAVQTAFVNAVAGVLAEQDASLAAGQLRRLRQLQQQGRRVSLLQLQVVQRDMARQLAQLAELCWCTVQEYVDQKLFLKSNTHSTALDSAAGWSDLPLNTQSSSSMNCHVLRQARGGEAARAAVAALQGTTAAACEVALPWPGQGGAAAAAAAARMAWAPSSWQLRQGIDGGHALLERLCAGLRDAGPQDAPLLRHLFAAAVQPVLHSLRSWSFLPDTQAAEAAAEATAMASFTAGSSSNNTQWDCTAGQAPHQSGAGDGADTCTQQLLFTAGGSSGGANSTAKGSWSGSRAAEAAMRGCLQQAWRSVCERPPGCPGFLAHVREPARVAGLQLHLLQLLGAPGQDLAERLGWLAELEQQELREVLSGGPGLQNAGADTAPSSLSPRLQAAAGVALQLPGPLGGWGGLLGGDSMSGGGAAGLSGASEMQRNSLNCNMTPQQLKQCAAIAADFRAARQAEVQRLLQDMAQRRVASQAAHELWLASRQEERRAAEEARARLAAEAAARRRQRQQRLLIQQQEDVAAAQARRLEARVQDLSLEQRLLHMAALQEHQQALQQLRQELARLESTPPPAAAAADGPAAPAADPGSSGPEEAAGGAAGAACGGGGAVPGQPVSAFAAVSGTAGAAGDLDGVLDAGDIELHLAAGGAADAADAASTRCTAGGEGNSAAEELEALVAGEQQQQHQRQRGTWGPPLQGISPAAGAPSGQQAAGPLAIIGSAAAAASAQQQAAAGRRSNSRPKVLPGMGRPVSAQHSRRNSSDDDGGGQQLLGSADGAAAATGAAAGAGVGRGPMGWGGARAGAQGSSLSSILGGFGGAAARGAGGVLTARGRWGVPVVPGAAAGAAGAHTLQRRASTGDLPKLDLAGALPGGTAAGGSSSSGLRGHAGQQGVQVLQRQASGGGPGWGRPSSSSGSRPGTPRGRRVSESAAGWEAPSQQQQQLHWQQSWHHMQQQQQQLLALQGLPTGEADAAGSVGMWAAAGGGGDSTAAAAAAASTGWLLSRSQQRCGGHAVVQEGQGNGLIVSWLMQQTGFVGPAAADAAAPATAAEGQGEEGCQDRASSAKQQAAAAPAATGPAAAEATAAAASAAPLVACLEVLLVQPVMDQARLTTVACWSLLLQEHRLLQRLGAIQGLFFQQQGDWVVLLCDALEPLLLQQQQQQQQKLSAGGGPGGEGLASPVVLQLLLEGAVQQSCLAKLQEAEGLSLQAEAVRSLGGWSSCPLLAAASGSSSEGSGQPGTAAAAAAAAGATDCLVLGYDAPWPVSLLLGEDQLAQYADIFSVLLRLRRLQQQLMKQWQPLNHRASSSSSSSRAQGGVAAAGASRRPRHASERGAPGSSSSSSSGSARRSTWHGSLQGQGSSGGLGAAARVEAGAEASGAAVSGGDAGGVSEGLSRLQELRRWHGLALHCIDSLLGYMLGELSGQQQDRFEAAVGRGPVELHVMLEAHGALLAAAREVCFLPPSAPHSPNRQRQGQEQQLQNSGGQELQGAAVGVGGGSRRVERVAYAIVESAWQLQQHVAALLASQQDGDGRRSSVELRGASSGRVLARAPSGFREGLRCSGLAAALEEDGGGVWEGVEAAGLQLVQLVEGLRRLLEDSMLVQVGHPLAGLAARLGV